MIRRIWTQIRNRPLVRDTITTTVLSVVGKAAGFLVPFFIAAWFGATSETDAFFFAYGIILFLSGIFAPVIEVVIVPFVSEAGTTREGPADFVGELIAATGGGLLILLLLFLPFLLLLLPAITRFDSRSLSLIAQTALLTAPLVILLVWTSILAGVLNSRRAFAPPAIAPLFRAVATVAVICFSRDTFGIHSIALGYLAGETVRLVLLGSALVARHHVNPRIRFSCAPKVHEFFRVAGYQTLGMVALALAPVVAKAMASWLEEGSVTVLHYAERFNEVPATFFASGLGVTLLSHLSLHYSGGRFEEFQRTLQKSLRWVGAAAAAGAVILIVSSYPIAMLFLGRGRFPVEKVGLVARTWSLYLLGLPAFLMSMVLARALLVLKRTKSLMKCAFWMTSLNVLFNFLLMRILRVAGLALAATLVNLFALFYLNRSLNGRASYGEPGS